MIIKSMSRKAPTFGQLMDYIARGSSAQTGTAFVRNIYASGDDRAAIVGQFLDNYRYLPELKGGNALYHELIALEPQPHLAPEVVETALHELAERYCAQRAPHQLAWGQVHTDTDFPHIHLMISANAVRSDRRVRMDRAYFGRVQRNLEHWREENLPQLRARVIYGDGHEKRTPKVPAQEGEMVRRTQTPSKKQLVFERLHSVLMQAASRKEALRAVETCGLQLYKRGQTWGVTDQQSGKRYRLRTLGLLPVFHALPERTSPNSRSGSTPEPQDPRAIDMLRRRIETNAQTRLDGFDSDRTDGR